MDSHIRLLENVFMYILTYFMYLITILIDFIVISIINDKIIKHIVIRINI